MKYLITIFLLYPLVCFAQTYEKIDDTTYKETKQVEEVGTIASINSQIAFLQNQINALQNDIDTRKVDISKRQDEIISLTDKITSIKGIGIKETAETAETVSIAEPIQ